MDLFADAYETESVAQGSVSRNSLTPANEDIKIKKDPNKKPKRRPSFMDVADKNQSYLIRSLFGEMPSTPGDRRGSSGSFRRRAPKKSQSFNMLFNYRDIKRNIGGTIHPFSLFRQNWDTCCMLLIAYTIVLLPVRFAFYWNSTNETWDWYKIFDTIIDFFFCTDVVLNFFTGYIDERLDTIILKRDKIMKHYLKGTFLLDVLASFPYELVQGFFVLNLTGVLRLWRLTRLMRLLRLQRMFRYSKRMAFFEKVPMFIKRMGNMFCLVFVFAHWNACFQYFVWQRSPTFPTTRGSPSTASLMTRSSISTRGACSGPSRTCCASVTATPPPRTFLTCGSCRSPWSRVPLSTPSSWVSSPH